MTADTGSGGNSILSAGLEALDLFDIGVAVSDGSGRLLFANQTAEQILLARDGLALTDDRVIASVGRWSNAALAKTVQQAARSSLSGECDRSDAILAVRRTSNKRPLTLLVRSLKSKEQHSNPTGPAVLIFIWDPELPLYDMREGLRELFGFTACEARLANLLMQGSSVNECCRQLDIRPSTARMHLANLFAKTGVQRQGQLVSLLWKSVGMVRTRHDRGSLAGCRLQFDSPTADVLETRRTVAAKGQQSAMSDALVLDYGL